MSATITRNFVFEEETCINCGVSFFIPDAFKKERLRDHKLFHCPNGHGQYYSAETEAERLRKEVAAAKQREETIRQQRDDALASKAKLELQAKRMRKRTAAGTCPCCKRTISQLARHMKTKHPDFVSG